MQNKSLSLWAAVLLLVGGLVHMIPGLYSGLTSLTGEIPWIQIVIGILSVLVALVLFAGDKEASAKDEADDKADDLNTSKSSDASSGSSSEI